MVPERAGSPEAEMGAEKGLDAVAHGNDDVEIVNLDWLVRICNMHFLHIAFPLQLPFLEDISDVPGNHRLVASEKLHHLRLRQPDCVAFPAHVQANLAVRRLEQRYLPAWSWVVLA